MDLKKAGDEEVADSPRKSFDSIHDNLAYQQRVNRRILLKLDTR